MFVQSGNVCCTSIEFPLILREVAAIGIRLSHASLGTQVTGKMLSNTSIICPKVRDSLGKLRVIPDRGKLLECAFLETRALG
jgi:hypothetical protein